MGKMFWCHAFCSNSSVMQGESSATVYSKTDKTPEDTTCWGDCLRHRDETGRQVWVQLFSLYCCFIKLQVLATEAIGGEGLNGSPSEVTKKTCGFIFKEQLRLGQLVVIKEISLFLNWYIGKDYGVFQKSMQKYLSNSELLWYLL